MYLIYVYIFFDIYINKKIIYCIYKKRIDLLVGTCKKKKKEKMFQIFYKKIRK